MGLDLREGGMETLGSCGSDSLIIFCHVLEHFRHPVLALQALRQQVGEGSLVYIEVPGVFSIHTTYGNPILFLQNAHAYHFCLRTLDYVLGQAGFERVCGNERIQAVYRCRSSVHVESPDRSVYPEILAYLRRVERRARWSKYQFCRYGANVIRALVGWRMAERLKRLILFEGASQSQDRTS